MNQDHHVDQANTSFPGWFHSSHITHQELNSWESFKKNLLLMKTTAENGNIMIYFISQSKTRHLKKEYIHQF